MHGTILAVGVGAFVAVLGVTSTAAGQIWRQFTILYDNTVRNDTGFHERGMAPTTSC